MKPQVYFGIAIRIILLFTVGALMTFLPEHLREFFGDTAVISHKSPWCDTCIITTDGAFDEKYDWGTRHYWYFWMMFCLFILSAVNVVASIRSLVLKHYPNTF